jgi:hypothetical protein
VAPTSRIAAYRSSRRAADSRVAVLISGDLAVPHDDLTFGVRRDACVMGHQHHGRALFAGQVHQQVHHLLAGQRVERAGRLVGEQDLGLDRQRPGERHPLRLAAGQFPGPPAALPVEPQPGQPRGGPLVGRLAADPVEQQRQRDVVGRGQLRH